MKRPKMSRIISFRVTEEDWLRIEKAAADGGETPNEWCRMTTLEMLKMPVGLTPNQCVLFAQMARATFLVENGFQLLADETLESDHWKNTAPTPAQTSTPSPIEPWKMIDHGRVGTDGSSRWLIGTTVQRQETGDAPGSLLPRPTNSSCRVHTSG